MLLYGPDGESVICMVRTSLECVKLWGRRAGRILVGMNVFAHDKGSGFPLRRE